MITLLSMGLAHFSGFGVLALFGMVAVGMAAACGTNVPAQSPELGAALGSCGRCPAMPEPRDWKLVDRMDISRVAPGRQVFVDWDAIPAMDSRGRYAHVRAIKIAGSAVFNAQGVNPAVTAYMVRSLYQLINLQDVGGHAYMAALDGRSVVDDYWLRHWRAANPPTGAIPANVPAGVFTTDCTLEFALVSRMVGASPIEGLIPLAALQQVDGSQGFRFTLGLGILGNPPPAGLALTSFVRDDGTTGLDVWADVVYLDAPVIDAPWSVREYTIAQPNGTLQRPEERTEYAAVRYFPEDAPANAGQQNAAGIDNITLQVAGMSFGEQRAIDFVRRQSSLEISGPESASALGLAPLQQPAEPGVTRPMLLILPIRARESSPAGPVVFKFSTQPSTFARFIHRTTACDDSDRAGKILAAIKCGPATCVQPGNTMPGVTDSTAPKVVIPLNGPG